MGSNPTATAQRNARICWLGAVEVTDAGHPFPFLMRNGAVTSLELTTQLPLGLATAPYRADTVALEPGDRLLMVTDGYLHRLDGRLDIEDFLRRSLGRHPARSSKS